MGRKMADIRHAGLTGGQWKHSSSSKKIFVQDLKRAAVIMTIVVLGGVGGQDSE